LAIYARYVEPIHLVLTDVVMPGMSGNELVRRLTAERSSLKVLFTSGYPGEAIARLGVFARDLAFLSKPFTAHALAHKVRAALDA
jgi:FixJ family two-component response regulator